MAFLEVNNVSIKGVSAAVPERKEFNKDFPKLTLDQLEQYIKTVGVIERRCAIHNGSLCTSDLCFEAADKLIGELDWNREEIGLLIFVSHTQDYKLPSTACILQDRLGLNKETMAFDVPLGCSGFVYGLGIAGSIVSQGLIKKALLLVGNTQSVYASPEDKSTALLFGDAGSAVALEYDEKQEESIKFHFQTDGSGYENLIVPDGGCRHPFNEHSAEMEEFEEGIRRSRLHEKMDGGAVFSFAFFNVPRSLKSLMNHYGISDETVDYLLLHQANRFMCNAIRKKLKMPEEKVPFNIDRFGNTSGTSIPLLMVTELQEQLRSQKLRHLACGFGVGLSLGSTFFHTDHIVVPDLIEVNQVYNR